MLTMMSIKMILGMVTLVVIAVIPRTYAVPKIPSEPAAHAKPSVPEIPAKLPISINPSVPTIVPKPLTPPVPSITLDPKIPELPTMPAMQISLLTIPDIPAIPEISDFNFELVLQKAATYYATLPQIILDEAKMMVPELIKHHGYICETHKITTSDGYILTMHRIPHGRTGPSENRPVVYVQHGILSSSADWIIPGPEKALAYILADAGYDVWLPNVRGTRYSRDHLTADPDKAKYWGFCWHDIAVYDVPAMIDYALNKTKQEKLFYIGHSQGTTAFYVMCSEKPEYNNKIRAQFSLAPIGYMSHVTSPLLRVISSTEGGLGVVLKAIGVNEFLPNTGFLGRVGKLLCSDGSVTQILCTNALFAVCGFNQKQMNATLLPVIMGHTPAGASTKQLLHYAQEINSGEFRQWDNGYLGNLKKYGNYVIPKYQLSNVTAPVYLYYSQNDWLSGERDVMRLYVELANAREKFLVADKKFNHIDYLYAIEARELVYDSVINMMSKH